MKKLLTIVLDSSVWIAFFLEKDTSHQEADDLINYYLKHNYIFLIPVFVYIEIINVLGKNGFDEVKMLKVKEYLDFHNQNRVIFPSLKTLKNLAFKYIYWFNLRSQDFTILLCCIMLKPSKFITFDKKLKINHQIYEEKTSSKKLHQRRNKKLEPR